MEAVGAATGSSVPTFQLQGVGKRYRHTWALRDCSLSLPIGRVIALARPDGDGKTTLLPMAADRLSTHASGQPLEDHNLLSSRCSHPTDDHHKDSHER